VPADAPLMIADVITRSQLADLEHPNLFRWPCCARPKTERWLLNN
jgi:hypothetical protein